MPTMNSFNPLNPDGITRAWARSLWYSPIRRPLFGLKQWETRKRAKNYFSSNSSRKELLHHIKSSLSTGAGLTDYHFLHAYILQRQPKRILELGSGATSVIMAHAISELKTDCKLISMEDTPLYHEDVKKLLPPHFAKFVDFKLSPRETVKWRDKIHGYRYREIPDEPYDMIFIDGPSDNVSMQSGVSLDAFYLLSERFTDRPVDIVIDYRMKTCRAFQSVLRPGRIKFDPVSKLGTILSVSGNEFLPLIQEKKFKMSNRGAWESFGMDPVRLN